MKLWRIAAASLILDWMFKRRRRVHELYEANDRRRAKLST